MARLREILGKPVWQGVGVLVSIAIALVGLSIDQNNPIWLYLLGLAIIVTVAFVLGSELSQRKSGESQQDTSAALPQRTSTATPFGIYLLSAVILLAVGYGMGQILSGPVATPVPSPTSSATNGEAVDTTTVEPSPTSNATNGEAVDTTTEVMSNTEVVTVTTVQADQGWQSTGLSVEAGRRVTFRVVDGEWNINPTWAPYNGTGIDNPNRRKHPLSKSEIDDGVKNPLARNNSYPLPEACAGALIAQVGERFVWVGIQRSFVAQESGEISLRINGTDMNL